MEGYGGIDGLRLGGIVGPYRRDVDEDDVGSVYPSAWRFGINFAMMSRRYRWMNSWSLECVWGGGGGRGGEGGGYDNGWTLDEGIGRIDKTNQPTFDPM